MADLEALRCPRTRAALDEAVALARWLRAEGTALSDLLHPVIGRCADADRPLLVALRRAVFRGRRPAGRVWSARRALPADLTDRVERWARALSQEPDIAQALAEDRSAAVAALRVAAGRDAFRFALASASPDLTRAVAGWLDDPTAPEPGPGALASLAKYLARAAVKPSPYASFTLSGLGGWCDGGPAVAPSGDLDWLSVPELDRPAVLALWDALAASPTLRDHVRLRVNPSVEEDGGRVWFLGAAAGEPIVSVASTEAVRAVLDFVRTAPEPTTGALVRHLDGGRDAVARLVELGLLERLRPFPDQSADPLDHLARWVADHDPDSPWPARLRRLRAESTERTARDLLDGMLTDLGRPKWSARRPVVLDNAVLPQRVVTCGRDQWQPVLADLEAIRGFLGGLDRSLPFKLRLAALFRDRFGPRARVPFLRLYREFRAHPGPRERSDPRRAVLAGLYGDSADVITVDSQVLAKLAAAWPAHVVAPGSVCCYGQELPGPRFVLNTVRMGYGWGITRTEHLLRTAGVTVPDRAPATSPDAALAECRAVFGSQLNQRAAAVPHVLDHPGGEPPDGPALSTADLHVRHDAARGRLVLCDRAGRPVRPLALGMLVADLLPPALRFLVAVFGEPQTAFTLPDDVGWRRPVDGVAHRPRLEVGRVVLGRAGWRVPATDLPARGASDAESLLALALWRDRHGLPQRCFARAAGRRDRSRRPVYLDFAGWFALSALPRPAEGHVVFEEALPDPSDAPLHGVHGQRVTELVFDLSESHG
ncbi:lantibiotic dehydratase [Actinosynnema sp. CA-248983]